MYKYTLEDKVSWEGVKKFASFCNLFAEGGCPLSRLTIATESTGISRDSAALLCKGPRSGGGWLGENYSQKDTCQGQIYHAAPLLQYWACF